MMRAHVRRRAGFTLVEIIVVVSLIAILAAIGAGAFFRLRGSQDESNTRATLSKIHSNLDTKWKVVVDDARKTVPATLIAFCGNDKDRALVVWTYAKLKNELPDTPDELVDSTSMGPLYTMRPPITLPDGTTLPHRQLFIKVARECVASRSVADPEPGLDANETTARQEARESGALLFVALSQTGGGGNVTGQDGTSGQVAAAGPGTKNLQYYKDAWDRPVGFVRHAFGPDIDLGNEGYTPPPAPAGTAYTKLSTIPGLVRPVRTSLDPGGKMLLINSWAGTMSMPNPARTALVTALNANRSTGRGGRVPLTLDNRNCVPTLVSAGANREFGDFLGYDDDGADNILSFRLRREGARGD